MRRRSKCDACLGRASTLVRSRRVASDESLSSKRYDRIEPRADVRRARAWLVLEDTHTRCGRRACGCSGLGGHGGEGGLCGGEAVEDATSRFWRVEDDKLDGLPCHSRCGGVAVRAPRDGHEPLELAAAEPQLPIEHCADGQLGEQRGRRIHLVACARPQLRQAREAREKHARSKQAWGSAQSGRLYGRAGSMVRERRRCRLPLGRRGPRGAHGTHLSDSVPHTPLPV